MDRTLIEYLINLIILVPIVLCLIVISLKLSKKGIDSFSMGAYVQVIERVSLSKDTTLYVVKMGETGSVIVSSIHNTQIIKELNDTDMEEIIRIKKEKQNSRNLLKTSEVDMLKLLNTKFKRKKDDGYTE